MPWSLVFCSVMILSSIWSLQGQNLFTMGQLTSLNATKKWSLAQGSSLISCPINHWFIHFSTIKSPHILELSGIGRKDVLDKIGVEVKVDLPGVGENVQEHLLFTTTYEIRSETQLETLDLMRNPEYAAERLKFK
jgi:GMC oxidoreductase